MELFLVDGTYEMLRHYYAVPPARDKQGREVGAVRAVLASVLGMIQTAGVPRPFDFAQGKPCLAVCARQGGHFEVWSAREISTGSQNPHPVTKNVTGWGTLKIVDP